VDVELCVNKCNSNYVLVVPEGPQEDLYRKWSLQYTPHGHKQHKYKSKAKAYGSHAEHSYCRPVNQHWDACAPLRRLSLAQANPPGAGLVTYRRTVQVSWIEDMEPKVPQQ